MKHPIMAASVTLLLALASVPSAGAQNVPPFIKKTMPEQAIQAANAEREAVMDPDGALDARTKHLIALGVAAQIPCKYCVYYHIEAAKHDGATGLVASSTRGTSALAASKEEYKSPGSAKEVLLKEPLRGVKDEEVTILHVTFPPGWVGGKHYHTGPVYVYVLSGTFVVREKGKDPQTLPAGTLYREPIGNPMLAHNASTTEAAEILVMQIGHPDEPLMIKTDF
jgi:AhpD family alkylhydroperoxidase